MALERLSILFDIFQEWQIIVNKNLCQGNMFDFKITQSSTLNCIKVRNIST